MPAPIYNICEPKQTISRIRGQQARCLPEATVTWDLASTNVCPMCSGSIYRYEKRYELVRKLEDLGYADRVCFFVAPATFRSHPGCLLMIYGIALAHATARRRPGPYVEDLGHGP